MVSKVKKSISFWQNFLYYKGNIISLSVVVLLLIVILPAEWTAPYNPYDFSSFDILSSLIPPSWESGGESNYLLGTDEQGRDVLSNLIYGCRLSIFIGTAASVISLFLGLVVGITSALMPGLVDSLFLRIADIQFTLPTLLLALMLDGVLSALYPNASGT